MRVKTLSSLVAVTGMLVSFAAQAQEAPAGEATPAAAPETTPALAASTARQGHHRRWTPPSPFRSVISATSSGIGIGALVRGEYNLIPNLNLTGRAGSHLPPAQGRRLRHDHLLRGPDPRRRASTPSPTRSTARPSSALVWGKASGGRRQRQRNQPRFHDRRRLPDERPRLPRRAPRPRPRPRRGHDPARAERRLQLLGSLSRRSDSLTCRQAFDTKSPARELVGPFPFLRTLGARRRQSLGVLTRREKMSGPRLSTIMRSTAFSSDRRCSALS